MRSKNYFSEAIADTNVSMPIITINMADNVTTAFTSVVDAINVLANVTSDIASELQGIH